MVAFIKGTWLYLSGIQADEAQLAIFDSFTSATAAGLGGDAKKLGFGTTGVSLCYHKHKDFVKLPKDQKDELFAWQHQK
jgi:hypothetical protein